MSRWDIHLAPRASAQQQLPGSRPSPKRVSAHSITKSICATAPPGSRPLAKKVSVQQHLREHHHAQPCQEHWHNSNCQGHDLLRRKCQRNSITESIGTTAAARVEASRKETVCATASPCSTLPFMLPCGAALSARSGSPGARARRQPRVRD